MTLTRAAVVSPFDPAFWSDPYRFYPALLDGPPRRETSLLPMVMAARYRDVVGVLRDPTRYSSRLPQLPFISRIDAFGGAPTMLFSDPPVHTRLRRLAARYFRESMLEGLAARVRSRARPLLDAIAARGEFDAVLDLAGPLPLAINAEILGIPGEDQPRLKGWSDAIFAATRGMLTVAGSLIAGRDAIDPAEAAAALSSIDAAIPAASDDAMAALRTYFRAHLERRRSRPGSDLISALLVATDGERMSPDELLALALLLLFAGNETTTNLIANGLRILGSESRHRDHLVAMPALLGGAVEEMLRYDSPVQMLLRYTTADGDVGGVRVPAGAAVLVMLGAANRDPLQFTDPDRFDIGRRPNHHLAFGDGIHTCLGSQLARLQGQLVLGEMLERFPRLRLRDPGAALEYSGSLLSRGLSRLPMAID